LDEAKKHEPKRAEAFYNEAILTEEYRAKRAPNEDAQVAEFEKAKRMYQSFIDNAGGKSAYADAVKVSKSRIQDINDTIAFMKESKEIAKQQAEMDRQMKEQEAADKKAAAEAAAADKAAADKAAADKSAAEKPPAKPAAK